MRSPATLPPSGNAVGGGTPVLSRGSSAAYADPADRSGKLAGARQSGRLREFDWRRERLRAGTCRLRARRVDGGSVLACRRREALKPPPSLPRRALVPRCAADTRPCQGERGCHRLIPGAFAAVCGRQPNGPSSSSGLEATRSGADPLPIFCRRRDGCLADSLQRHSATAVRVASAHCWPPPSGWRQAQTLD